MFLRYLHITDKRVFTPMIKRTFAFLLFEDILAIYSHNFYIGLYIVQKSCWSKLNINLKPHMLYNSDLNTYILII